MTSFDTTSDTLVPESSAPGALDRIATRLVLRALEGLEEGAIVLTLPDGTTRRFGREGARPIRLEAHSWGPLRALVLGGDLGAAEAYLDGEWSSRPSPPKT